MWKTFISKLCAVTLGLFCTVSLAVGADAQLSEHSTLEGVLKRGELRIGLEVGYWPFEMLDKRSGLHQKRVRYGNVRHTGQQLSIIGFDIDIGIEMARKLGVKPVFVNTRWPGIIPALHLGRYDIIFGGMSVTEERKRKVDFCDAFMTVGQTVLLNPKHKGKVRSYKDLNDPRYIVVSKPGTTGEKAVLTRIPYCTYRASDTEKEGAMQVLNGKADAFVYDFPFNAVFHNIHPKDKLIFLDTPFTSEPIAWAIRKNDPDFLQFANGFLAEIKKDSRFERIYNKWFKDTAWLRYVR